MLVRPATIEDCATLAKIQVDSYRTAYRNLLPQAYLDQFSYEEQAQDWRDLLSGKLTDLLLVVESEAGQVVGYALGRRGLSIPNAVNPSARFDCELVALHVCRDFQRRGVGRQLIAAMAQKFLEIGCTSLM